MSRSSAVRRCGAVVAAVALLLFSPWPTPASAVDFGLGGNVSVHWSFPATPSGGVKDITFPMAVNPASEQTGLYYAQQFWFGNNLNGYTGLQPQQTSGASQRFRAVFSVFASGGAGTPGNTSSSDPNCRPGADAGAGQSCAVLFDATYGHTYNLTVKRTGTTSTTDTWSGDVYDSAGTHPLVAHIGSWTLPSGLLKGSGDGFVEYVNYNANSTCAHNTVSDVYFGGPSTTDVGGLSGTVSDAKEYGSCAGQSNFAAASAGSGRHVVRGFITVSPFRNASSGLCLDVPSNSPGARTDIATCDGSYQQLWGFMPDSPALASPPVPTTPLSPQGVIQGFLQSGVQDTSGNYLCLDNNSQTTAGGKVIVWPCSSDNTNQQWQLYPDGTLRSTNSGLCIDPAGTAPGTLLTQQTCTASTAQTWPRGANV